MTNHPLAQSYLVKARSRLKILNVLLDDDNYSDVIHEAQEIVEPYFPASRRQARRRTTGRSTPCARGNHSRCRAGVVAARLRQLRDHPPAGASVRVCVRQAFR